VLNDSISNEEWNVHLNVVYYSKTVKL